ncbi:MAG: hypothetical protein V2I46_08150 [Bacteroides sp.]|jgi:hypothetical protein|nr:hypothetical protein [Bacteroides sp.]
MKKFFPVFLICLLMLSQESLAQKSQSIRLVGGQVAVEEVADSSLIFLFPAMQEAEITHTNGSTYTASVNYNILGDVIEIQTRRGIQIIDPTEFSKMKVKGSTFIHLPDVGYLEVLSEGKLPLYQKRSINVSARPVVRGAYGTIDNTSSIDQATYIHTGPSGEFYLLNSSNQEIEITLRYNEKFMIGKDKTLVEVKNQRQLLRDFPEFRKELRDFIQKKNTDFSNPSHLTELVMFLEQLP